MIPITKRNHMLMERQKMVGEHNDKNRPSCGEHPSVLALALVRWCEMLKSCDQADWGKKDQKFGQSVCISPEVQCDG